MIKSNLKLYAFVHFVAFNASYSYVQVHVTFTQIIVIRILLHVFILRLLNKVLKIYIRIIK